MVNPQAAEMLDPLFSELKDGICLSEPEGPVIYMNPAARRLLGLEADEADGRAACELVCARLESSGGGRAADACPLRRREERAATFQGRYGPRAAYRWGEAGLEPRETWLDLRVHCQLLTTPLFDSWSFDKLLTTLEDIGPERELERHKEDWRNMIAHDLRSPMTNVLGTLQLLEESPARAAMSADEGKLLAASIRSSRRLLALLNLYLDIAKLDAGLMRVRAEPVALPELAAACADEQQMAAAEKRITVALAVPPGLRARADADLLFRVLQNLLANALKYAPPGGRVEVRGRRDGAAVELSVRDDGPGIAPEDQDRLFDRFFQAEARRGGKIQGTGLGLTFCREALKVMKGTIGVSSEVGQGSAFLVRLPAA